MTNYGEPSYIISPKAHWFFGLPGSGKTQLAKRRAVGNSTTLDGDDLRDGLCSDLGFSMEARNENLRRAAHVAKILIRVGISPICSFVTPLESQRFLIKEILGDSVLFIFVDTPLEQCMKHKPELYRRAVSGEIPQFTGISSPFERPTHSHLRVDTAAYGYDLDAASQFILDNSNRKL